MIMESPGEGTIQPFSPTVMSTGKIHPTRKRQVSLKLCLDFLHAVSLLMPLEFVVLVEP